MGDSGIQIPLNHVEDAGEKEVTVLVTGYGVSRLFLPSLFHFYSIFLWTSLIIGETTSRSKPRLNPNSSIRKTYQSYEPIINEETYLQLLRCLLHCLLCFICPRSHINCLCQIAPEQRLLCEQDLLTLAFLVLFV